MDLWSKVTKIDISETVEKILEIDMISWNLEFIVMLVMVN